MTDTWPLWLVAGLALLMLEVHQQAFFALFVSAASFAAAIADAAGGNLWVQGITFAVVGFGGLALVRRPIAAYFARRQTHLTVPGVYGGFVGQSALAIDVIGDEHHPGHAQLGSDTFLAITDAVAPLAAQTRLIVTAVHGTTLLVREEVHTPSA